MRQEHRSWRILGEEMAPEGGAPAGKTDILARMRFQPEKPLLMGLGTAGGNGFVMQALTREPAVVVFPMALGGAVLAVWAFAALRYRERVTVRTAATMAVGLAGLVLLAI